MGLSQYRQNVGPIEDFPRVKDTIPVGPPKPLGVAAPAPFKSPEQGGTLRMGSTPPSIDSGQDGDYYINGSTGDIYKKKYGVYSIEGNARVARGTVASGGPGPAGAKGADGAAGAPGAPGADGGSVNLVAFAALPAAGTSGRIYYFTDSPLIARDNGATWDYFYQGYKITPLDQSSWTWDNQGTATIVQSKGFVTLTVPNEGAENFHVRYVTAPAAPYTLTVGFLPGPLFSNSLIGIAFRSAAGVLSGVLLQNPASSQSPLVAWHHNNSPTSFNTQLQGAQFTFPGLIWLRLINDTTNLTFQYSFDRSLWITAKTGTIVSLLTPDHLAIYGEGFSGTAGCAGTFIGWDFS